MHLRGLGRKLELLATLEIETDRVVDLATLELSARAFGIDHEGMQAELAEDAELEIEPLLERVVDQTPP